MKEFLLNIIPDIFLKKYNRFSNKRKYGTSLKSVGFNVSMINCKIGTNNVIGSNASLQNVQAEENLIVGDGANIRNTKLEKNNNIGINSQVYDSEFGQNALIYNHTYISKSKLGCFNNIYKNASVLETELGDYSYIGQYSKVSKTKIGKFCSIGPNLISGWGVHPVDGISTHPMFYSTLKHNGISFTDENKIVERKTIQIGNDVFIGMNVLILDGVEIGDGAIIGAGAVVSKNIPPYAIAVGNPIQIIRHRYSPEVIEHLLNIKWWDWEFEKLKEVERYFYDVNSFIVKYKTDNESLQKNS